MDNVLIATALKLIVADLDPTLRVALARSQKSPANRGEQLTAAPHSGLFPVLEGDNLIDRLENQIRYQCSWEISGRRTAANQRAEDRSLMGSDMCGGK
jgi:hypothetical protein